MVITVAGELKNVAGRYFIDVWQVLPDRRVKWRTITWRPLSLYLSHHLSPPPPPEGFLLPHLTVSLSVCSPDLSLFNLLRPYYVPICVTHEACLRVKNKRWKGKRGVEDWWLGAGIWRVEEGGLAVEAAVCGKVRSLFINSCLFMSPVNVASQGMKAFCLALSVPDTDPNERVVSGGR